MGTKKKIVGVSEARKSLASLIRQMGKGGEIVVTRRGEPIARILPPVIGKAHRGSYRWLIKELHEVSLRRGSVLKSGETWREFIHARS